MAQIADRFVAHHMNMDASVADTTAATAMMRGVIF